MKVCTDSCLFGAYVPVGKNQEILDIGTGTGLLALMLAQKEPTNKITGVEIDSNAFEQATQNVNNSSFNRQIEIIHCDINEFAQSKVNKGKFDLIISNPPYFQNSLKSSFDNDNLAKHSTGLNFEQLAEVVKLLLSPKGAFFVVLPARESVVFREKIIPFGLYWIESIEIKNFTNTMPFRVIDSYMFTPKKSLLREEIVIYKQKSLYEENFINYLKEYYLDF